MELKRFYNKHEGETCLVIGNGPSLKDVPDEFLFSYPTFGANRIYLRLVPKYYVAVNPLVIEQNKKEIQVFDWISYLFIPKQFGFGIPLNCVPRQAFSFEPDEWVYEGYTVTFVSLQLAYYMGFSTVLLVGVDHRYQYAGKPNEQCVMETDDPNHFDPKYFKGQQWNNPDLEKSEQAYRMAERAYRENGRKIINLTPNSALDVFEKADIDEYRTVRPA